MADDSVLLDIDGGTATVTLDEPDVRNALNTDVAAGIRESLAEVADSDARCVVIEGTGEVFSAGGNIRSMRERIESDRRPAEKVRDVRDIGESVRRLHEFELPVVAKIDGAAFGAGASLALACDVQVASDRSSISFGFRQVGLAIDAGTSYFLPRVVGENTAQELVLTGEVVKAEEAVDLGLFNRVYPADEFDERVAAFVDRIASGPTVALATSKRLVRQGLNSDLETALANESAAQAQTFESADHEEGVTAFLDGRDPEYRDE